MTKIKHVLCVIAVLFLFQPVFSQQIDIDNDDYHFYGPNSTWGEYLKVGGNGRGTTEASVVATNGNLHLDSQDGNATYINHYSEGKTFINPRGGNVGIGTSNPLTKLHVINNTSGEVLRLSSNHTSAQIKLNATASNGIDWSMMSSADGASLGAGKYSIYGNSQHRFVIDQNGNVGIGSTAPGSILHLNQNSADAVLKIQSDGSNYSAINFSRERQTGEDVTGASIYMQSNPSHNDATLSIDVNTATGAGGVNGPHLDLVRKSSHPNNYINFSNANVGIGTASPAVDLDVNGTARFGLATDGGIQISRFTSALTDVPGSTGGIQFTGPNNSHVVFDIKGNDNNDGFYVRVPSTLQASPTVDKTALVVKATGRIGFGTASPAGQFSIARSGANSGGKTWNSVNQASIDFYADSQDAYNRYMDISAVGEVSGGNGGSNIRFITNPGNSNQGVERMLIKSNGAVGIGTSSTGSHKLAVEGSIGSREVKVEASGWSDFVFNEDYKLNTLEEVEDYIQENKHLPEIPSEAEVLQNGINLGEMDAKLLQKVEELTLYMIEMNKEMKSQKEEINLLKSENSELKSEMSELQKNN